MRAHSNGGSTSVRTAPVRGDEGVSPGWSGFSAPAVRPVPPYGLPPVPPYGPATSQAHRTRPTYAGRGNPF